MLEVEVAADKVIISGRTSTYYLKQLALHAVLDIVGVDGARRIELKIEVSGASINVGNI